MGNDFNLVTELVLLSPEFCSGRCNLSLPCPQMFSSKDQEAPALGQARPTMDKKFLKYGCWFGCFWVPRGCKELCSPRTEVSPPLVPSSLRNQQLLLKDN